MQPLCDRPPCSVNAQCSHDVNPMRPELSATGAAAYHQTQEINGSMAWSLLACSLVSGLLRSVVQRRFSLVVSYTSVAGFCRVQLGADVIFHVPLYSIVLLPGMLHRQSLCGRVSGRVAADFLGGTGQDACFWSSPITMCPSTTNATEGYFHSGTFRSWIVTWEMQYLSFYLYLHTLAPRASPRFPPLREMFQLLVFFW